QNMSRLEARFQLQRGAFTLDCHFTAPLAGITALFGVSAAGKTTVLRCLAGLQRASIGQLHIDGACWQDETRDYFLPSHRRAIGYVFQEASLFAHLSVRGNLEYGYRRVPAPQRRIIF